MNNLKTNAKNKQTNKQKQNAIQEPTFHVFFGSRDGAVMRVLAPHQRDPWLDSRSGRHMWVKFAVGSLLCCERFLTRLLRFSPFSKKKTLLNSNSIRIARTFTPPAREMGQPSLALSSLNKLSWFDLIWYSSLVSWSWFPEVAFILNQSSVNMCLLAWSNAPKPLKTTKERGCENQCKNINSYLKTFQ